MDTTKLNRLAIFIRSAEHLEHLDKIKDLLSSSYDDIFIVSDRDLYYPEYANITMFNLRFIKIDIIFIGLESYLKYRDFFDSADTILALSNHEFMSSGIDIKKNKIKKMIEL